MDSILQYWMEKEAMIVPAAIGGFRASDLDKDEDAALREKDNMPDSASLTARNVGRGIAGSALGGPLGMLAGGGLGSAAGALLGLGLTRGKIDPESLAALGALGGYGGGVLGGLGGSLYGAVRGSDKYSKGNAREYMKEKKDKKKK